MRRTDSERPHRLRPAARTLALLFVLLVPSVALGSGAIVVACLHPGLASGAGLQPSEDTAPHDHHGSDEDEGHEYGCSWLGPCSASLTALQPTVGSAAFRDALLASLPRIPTASSPRSSALAYLRPRANPPPHLPAPV